MARNLAGNEAQHAAGKAEVVDAAGKAPDRQDADGRGAGDEDPSEGIRRETCCQSRGIRTEHDPPKPANGEPGDEPSGRKVPRRRASRQGDLRVWIIDIEFRQAHSRFLSPVSQVWFDSTRALWRTLTVSR